VTSDFKMIPVEVVEVAAEAVGVVAFDVVFLFHS